ncbi:hypothetical protein HELRODRAFT_162478 [Helobdella robusta]|uniref:Uncharacterized protein n=1 Tax=Helobdella robusta TaxID=6412 RepID=T1ESQ3_HELRO|nr:hypothetical protein HELRODRAFT_162478 [Helobdella robusta]ESN99003.1 hypothetical protein HELRODRAFT_162478 [Helobdella robusta]
MNGANTGLEVGSRFRNTNQHFDGDLSVNGQHVDECINNRITSCNICHHNSINNNNNVHDNSNNKSKKIKVVENLNYGSDNNLNMHAISLFSPVNNDTTNNINNNNNKNINEIISINKQNNKTFDKKSTNNNASNKHHKMNSMKNLRPVLTMDKWLTMLAIMSFLYLDGVECTHQSWWSVLFFIV